jgi:hypothetical protein
VASPFAIYLMYIRARLASKIPKFAPRIMVALIDEAVECDPKMENSLEFMGEMSLRRTHLVRWVGLNMLNKDPRTNSGPSSWGNWNTRDTLSPGASSPVSPHARVGWYGLTCYCTKSLT